MSKVNKKIMVHAYKRNGWLYRVWEFPKVIDVGKDYICVSSYNSNVITSDKDSNRNFRSKNLKNSFWFFFKDEWFNIIATLTESNEIQYYVNIASPYIYEEEAIKYYDLDLDIKMKSIDANFYRILDVEEFNENKIKFKYEKELINKSLMTLEKFKNPDFRKKIISKINVNVLKKYSQLLNQNKG